MQLGRLMGLIWIPAGVALVSSLAGAEEAKTFPGASIVLPAVLPILGTIIPALLPGAPSPGLPGVSVSHATSIVTSVHMKPIAISHSGSVSTSSATNAGATASIGGSTLTAQSSSGTASKVTPHRTGPSAPPLLSKRWRKFFQKLG
ncbi:uncharacterized protein LOC118461736 [Anopheles albimanus]|uniref:uncharacterized protein LOC118461736 n=1 Tax=Anopheles albimanus TaxID=7167 RepID=UPI001640447E|nr:uncharacterized protein LOC118461736 [Anopheles albimanus]